MKIRAFITHKLKEGYKDCQDRFSVNTGTKSIAVSDGMSQSIFQKLWAEILVDAYCKDEENANPFSKKEGIKVLAEKWHKTLEQRKEEGKLNWRAVESLERKLGAGATLLGIRFDGNKWSGYVLGDSCLLTVTTGNKIASIFSSRDGEFDSYPDYFDSNGGQKGEIKPIYGELHKDEKLLLVSDPFSDFFYKKKEAGEETKLFIEALLKLNNHDEFCELVDKWRSKEGFHNDDTTLVIVEYDESMELNVSYQDNIDDLIKNEEKNTPTTVKHPIVNNTNITSTESINTSTAQKSACDRTICKKEFDDFGEKAKNLFGEFLKDEGERKKEKLNRWFLYWLWEKLISQKAKYLEKEDFLKFFDDYWKKMSDELFKEK